MVSRYTYFAERIPLCAIIFCLCICVGNFEEEINTFHHDGERYVSLRERTVH